MSSTVLFLGPVEFQAFEVPASINIGGAQRLAIHRLPGGTRVIDALGRDDSDISFSGTFSGADATLRARLVDEMRVAGSPISLTWDVFFYSVIIRRFEADYRSGWWIPYRVTCSVVRDEASNVVTAVVSLADSISSDVTAASNLATTVGVDLSYAQNAVAAPNATKRGAASHLSTLTALSSAGVDIGNSIIDAESKLEVIFWPKDGQMQNTATSFGGIVFAAQQISVLRVAKDYVGRAAINLTNAST